jgi:adenylate cyclase
VTVARRDVHLADIPSCFEGIVPSAIATVAPDGTPNVTYLSVVQYIDEDHVALSRQFFKKTDENTATNPYAQVQLTEATTGLPYLVDLRYDRTETEGPRFEQMRTKLDAVAAYEGMANVFKLKGVDICEVLAVRAPSGAAQPVPPRGVDLARIEAVSGAIRDADDLEELLQVTLDACRELLGCEHGFVMLLDEAGERLYTVASAGYESPGTGSEVRLGEGVIGLAAQRRVTIRLTHLARDLAYSQAARAGSVAEEHSIPLPVLTRIQSQLVSPMLAHRSLVGVIALESEATGAFQSADECVAGIIANQVAMTIASLNSSEAPSNAPSSPSPPPVQVKYYRDDESVFLDNEYLIKGLAGGILWRLLRTYQLEGRTEFSNRELRLDPTIELPDIKDNLEARLILLRKRLEERCDYLRLERTSRGRFRLVVSRPLVLAPGEGPE